MKVYGGTHATNANVVQFRSGATETMRIDGSGKVGIGTATPGEALDINGRLKLESGGVSSVSLDPTVNVNGAARTMRISNTTSNATEGFQFYNSNASTSLMMIQQNGNVGIGTTGPNELLTVEGVTSLKETSAPTATSNYGKIYVKSSDSKLYFKDDGGAEYDLTAGSSAGDITGVTTNSGSGLSGGAASGTPVLQVVVDNSTIDINGSNQIEVKDGGITDAKITTVAVDKVANGAGKYFGYRPNNTACANGEILKWNNASTRWECGTDADSGGDITAVTTAASSGLVGGSTTGAVALVLDFGTGSDQVKKNSDVPHCTSGQVLSMSAGPVYTWSCGAPSAQAVLADADGNTKIQVEKNANEDKIRFDTAGTERMIIDDTGRVGIGTAPSFPLDVGATGVAGQLMNFGNGVVAQSNYIATNSRAFFGYDGTANAAVLQGATGKGINFNVNSSTFGSGTAMRISTSGQVGVGGTPSYPLDVRGTDGTYLLALGTAGSGGWMAFKPDGTNGSVLRYGGAGAKAPWFQIQGVGDSPRMTFDDQSRVGVGPYATTPAAQLDVVYAGNNGVSPMAAMSVTGITSSLAPGTGVRTKIGMSYRSGDAAFTVPVETSSIQSGADTYSDINNGFLSFHTLTAGTQTEKVRITSAGQVAIGTGGAANELLTVEGATSLRELASAPSATSNYGKIYVKSSDSKLYFKDDGGTEYDLTVGSGGDITGVTTSAGSGLSGGAASGTPILQVVVDNSTVDINGSNQVEVKDAGVTNAKIVSMSVDKVTSGAGKYFTYAPNNVACGSNEVLKWNLAQSRWDCGTDLSGGAGDFKADGTVQMTGNIRLNGKWLSGDGGNEGIQVDSAGRVGVGAAPVSGVILEVSAGSGQSISRFEQTNSPVATVPTTSTTGIELYQSGDYPLNSYGTGIKFMANDGDFTAVKFLAGIYPRATEAFTNSSKSGMAIDFLTTANGGGTSATASVAMTLDQNGGLAIGTTAAVEKLTVEGVTAMKEGSAPSATANYGKIYVKSSDSKLYFKDDGGTEYDLTLGSGGDITGVTTSAGSGLSGGAASGTPILQVVVDNSTVDINGSNQVEVKDAGVTNAKIVSMAVDKITSGAGKYLTYLPNNAACADGGVLKWNNASTRWECGTDSDSGGDITGITTAATSGLVGGGTTGNITLLLDFGTAADQVKKNSDVPNCSASQKLDMSAGPVYTWGCSTITVSKSLADADSNTKVQVEKNANEDRIRFDTAGSERMVIDASGNIGIGTTLPHGSFTIAHSESTPLTPTMSGVTISGTGNVATIENSSATDGAYSALELRALNAASNIQIGYMALTSATAANSSNLVFGTRNSANTYERMRIDASGNVGIGMTAGASNKLDVSGNINASGTVTATGFSGPVTSSVVGAGVGSNTNPSLSFSGDPDTGFYDVSSNNLISVAVGGAKTFDFSSTGLVSPTTGGANVTTGNGTAATPTYSFAGDPSTGWFRPAASTLAASTGGGERVRIDSAGNVGIGTTNPIRLLHVEGSDSNTSVTGSTWPSMMVSNIDSSTNNIEGIDFSTKDISGTQGATAKIVGVNVSHTNGAMSGALAFVTRNAGTLFERMRIDNAGNVGIGTTNPVASFDVMGTTTTSGVIAVGARLIPTAISDTAGSVGLILSPIVSPSAAVSFEYGNTLIPKLSNSSSNVTTYYGNFMRADVATPYTGAVTDLHVVSIASPNNTAGASITNGYGLYIADILVGTGNQYGVYQVGTNDKNFFAGNVGIGTTNPISPLHVSEAASSTTLGGTAEARLVNTDQTVNNFTALKFSTADSASAVISNGYIGMLNTNHTASSVSGDMLFATMNAGSFGEKMRITGTGLVGIGLTPAAEKLEVNGNVLATAYLHSSDRRLKTDIQTMSGLDVIRHLRGVHFKWRTDMKDDMGFIAQEVEEVLPELVHTNPVTGMKSVKYDALTSPLVESVKELDNMCRLQASDIKNIQAKMDEHDSRVRQLEAKVQDLQSENQQLKSRLDRLEKAILRAPASRK